MPLLLSQVRTVMIFTDDPIAVASWYAPLFGSPRIQTAAADETDFAWFETGGMEVAFHPADSTLNASGRSLVAYWAVASVKDTRAALLARGASQHRGPLVIDEFRSICQLIDPFGNVIGLDGPA